MTRPKGKLFALLAIFVAIGLITASGAFTSVTAERSVTVDVVGDSAALLQLNADSPYATENPTTGELEISLTSSELSSNDGSPEGVNPNATTVIATVFNITNSGTNSVGIYLDGGTSNNNVTLVNSSTLDALPTASNNAITLGVGQTYSVGLQIDTTAGNGTQVNQGTTITDTITIVADANAP